MPTANSSLPSLQNFKLRSRVSQPSFSVWSGLGVNLQYNSAVRRVPQPKHTKPSDTRLGINKTRNSRLYINKLEEVDITVLKELSKQELFDFLINAVIFRFYYQL